MMGLTVKKDSRRQYVIYRLNVLRDLRIAPPSKARIKEMMDETKMSEIAVDAVFRECIERANSNCYGGS